MSNNSKNSRELVNRAQRDAQQNRPPANVSNLGYNERKAYNDTYAYKRK